MSNEYLVTNYKINKCCHLGLWVDIRLGRHLLTERPLYGSDAHSTLTRVDGLPHTAEQPQAVPLVLGHESVPLGMKRADRGGSRVEDGHLELVDDAPAPAGVGPGRNALKQHLTRDGGEGDDSQGTERKACLTTATSKSSFKASSSPCRIAPSYEDPHRTYL